MSLKMGIVGLPNVGKSTLFNTITNLNVEAANYPFATIKPNVGIVEVDDFRLKHIDNIFHAKKVIPTSFEFIDIAGLIAGASKGEGLGNAFLANIKSVDAICQVVRCFNDKDIIHVEGKVDAIRDIEIINLELILHDIEQLERYIRNFDKLEKHNRDKKTEVVESLTYLKKILLDDRLLNQAKLTDDELQLCKKLQLLTIKPFLFLGNISDQDLVNPKGSLQLVAFIDYCKKNKYVYELLPIDFEFQISKLDNDDKIMFLEEYNIKEPLIKKLILKSYQLLNLKTFFTAGKQEVRAWTYIDGMSAPECAKIIHSDFQKGFIKLEVYSYEDLIKIGSEKKLRENGKIRIEGKDYKLKDGDVCYFKFNV